MKELKEFLEVVANDDFVEGHEVLEGAWKSWKNTPAQRDESFILKGLINGSTALALKVRNKDKPALQVWSTFLKYSPLIDEISSKHTNLYKEAQELLHVKYDSMFNS